MPTSERDAEMFQRISLDIEDLNAEAWRCELPFWCSENLLDLRKPSWRSINFMSRA
jgi:hypothetical protein